MKFRISSVRNVAFVCLCFVCVPPNKASTVSSDTTTHRRSTITMHILTIYTYAVMLAFRSAIVENMRTACIVLTQLRFRWTILRWILYLSRIGNDSIFIAIRCRDDISGYCRSFVCVCVCACGSDKRLSLTATSVTAKLFNMQRLRRLLCNSMIQMCSQQIPSVSLWSNQFQSSHIQMGIKRLSQNEKSIAYVSISPAILFCNGSTRNDNNKSIIAYLIRMKSP